MSTAGGLAWGVASGTPCAPSCVIDARLLLSPHGPLVAARVARHFTAWLPREAWEVVRDAGAWRTRASLLVPRVYCASLRKLPAGAEAAADIVTALDQWARLPHDAELASLPLHRLGDRADESVVPAVFDCALRERCEQLQRGLDDLVRQAAYDLPRGEIVSSCVRDAAALCAALGSHQAFVLTCLEADGQGPPAFCNYLDAWSLPVSEVVDAHRRARALVSLFDRAGLRTFAWAGLRLAAVHLFAPRSPAVGRWRATGVAHEAVVAGEPAMASLWDGAQVCWHEV